MCMFDKWFGEFVAFFPILLVVQAGALSVFQTPALTRSGNPSKTISLVACITFSVYAAKLPVPDGRLLWPHEIKVSVWLEGDGGLMRLWKVWTIWQCPAGLGPQWSSSLVLTSKPQLRLGRFSKSLSQNWKNGLVQSTEAKQAVSNWFQSSGINWLVIKWWCSVQHYHRSDRSKMKQNFTEKVTIMKNLVCKCIVWPLLAAMSSFYLWVV